MAKREVERALKKQQLQIQSRQLRNDWEHHAQGVKPAFSAADTALRGLSWLRQHPAVPVAVVVAVVVVKPALVWRVGRGAWLGWQAWQRYRHLVLPSDEVAPEESP